MATLASAPGGDSATGGSKSATNSKAKKRTKTGCFTCRKRRIKCGEERPICKNCKKSGRQCEGYNQIVNSKPTIGSWPNNPGVVNNIRSHTVMPFSLSNQSDRGPDSTTGMREGMLRPSHPNAWPSESYAGGSLSYIHSQAYRLPLLSPPHQRPLHSPNRPELSHTQTASAFLPPPSHHAYSQTEYIHDPYTIYQAPPQHHQTASKPPVSGPYNRDSSASVDRPISSSI